MSSTGTNEGQLSQSEEGAETDLPRRNRRTASVYDAVAGRVGFNGFLSQAQIEAGATSLKPDEVLLRRLHAPVEPTKEYYNADERLKPHLELPDSDLLRALHQYASDHYSAHTRGEVNHSYRSFDETALLAFAVLMEAATAQVLGESGDMVLVEPEGLDQGLPEDTVTKHQVRGRVEVQSTGDAASSEASYSTEDRSSEDNRQIKRRRHRYAD